MAEKNILAYFKSPDKAQEAAAKLKDLGVIDLQIDRFRKYPGDGVSRFMNPITGQIESLADLTLGLEDSGPDSRVLLDADVTASGMSDGGNDVLTGHDILLTVVVDEASHHKALEILRQAGAVV